MAFLQILITLSSLSGVFGQLSLFQVLQCGNLNPGVCRFLSCEEGEYSVYPYTCSIYTYFYGVTYRRCVPSMPCYCWSGTCQTSCDSTQEQRTNGATCSSSTVCCIPSSLVGSTTPTVSTAATSTSSPPSVADRQGACGMALRTATSSLSLQPRIIGGTRAQPTDWPWMVRLVFTLPLGIPTIPTGFCAGVLVDNDTVVTVAHCVAGIDASLMQVILADYDISTFDLDEEVVNVVNSTFLSSFSRGVTGNDFAVLKLARNITYTDRKLPACLPDPTIPIVSDSDCYIAGWGVSETAIGGPLRAANVRLLSRQECEQNIAASGQGPLPLPQDIICTENPITSPSDGCLYDDGDMLVCRDTQNRWSLVGVMSEYTCGRGLPVLFTNVTQYTEATLQQL